MMNHDPLRRKVVLYETSDVFDVFMPTATKGGSVVTQMECIKCTQKPPIKVLIKLQIMSYF